MKNRATARWLKNEATVCSECGEKGAHWVQWPNSIEDIFGGGRTVPSGFWTCAKFYGPDGRRIDA